MKICSTCKKEKDYSGFYKNNRQLDGYGIRCKDCCKEYRVRIYPEKKDKINAQIIEWRKRVNANNRYAEVIKKCNKKFQESKKDGFHYVYLLPESNYVGCTSSLYYRMIVHKSSGRDVSGYKILGKFLDREDALRLETKYHDMGYEGKHKGNRYVRK
jgi:hypothetical protein